MKGRLSVIKLLFSFFIIVMILMLWWSFLLIEQDLKQLTTQMQVLSKQMSDLKHQMQRTQSMATPHEMTKTTLSQTDPNLPNLLKEDPFYKTTLPQMLGAQFKPQGVRREAILGKPPNLHPFNGFATISSLQHMCSVSLAKNHFGIYETMAPDMALKIEKRGNEYWIHLRDNVYWQPLHPSHFAGHFELADHFLKKHPVTAHDFKFFYDAVMNPHVSEAKASALRTYFADIEEMRVIDDCTLVVRWKQFPMETNEGEIVHKSKYSAQSLTGSLQPLPRFVFQYFADGQKIITEEEQEDTYRTHSIWAQNFTEHWAKNVIVGCGPWLFEGMDEEKISFIRNPDFYAPYDVLVERIVYTFKESPEHIWQDFKTGKIDSCHITPTQQSEYKNFLESNEYSKQKKTHCAIKELDYVDLAYYYLGWNQKRPFFQDSKIRQALTMAIDRDQIIQQNLNEMALPITGPFFRYSKAYNDAIEPWPFNPDRARQLLDQAGWVDMNGDGIRDKLIEGRVTPFRFTLIYYVKSHFSKAIAEYIQSQLREVGIDCKLHGLDLPDLSRKFDDKNFDAVFLGWKLGSPPEDPLQLWHSSGATVKGSSNTIGFAHEEADRIMQRLSYEDDSAKRILLYHAFHKIIHEEAPYTFLYAPKVKFLYREYLQNLFIPLDRQDLVPGATMSEPDTRVIYIK